MVSGSEVEKVVNTVHSHLKDVYMSNSFNSYCQICLVELDKIPGFFNVKSNFFRQIIDRVVHSNKTSIEILSSILTTSLKLYLALKAYYSIQQFNIADLHGSLCEEMEKYNKFYDYFNCDLKDVIGENSNDISNSTLCTVMIIVYEFAIITATVDKMFSIHTLNDHTSMLLAEVIDC